MRASGAKVPRRNFLKSTGAAALGAALAGGSAMAQEGPDSGRKVRIGVVGGGFGCSFHWHQDPNCIVEAVSDLRPDRRRRLQEVYQCEKAYESLEKLILDDKVEAVAVFTGAPDHVRHVTACMNAGKHVICAVPAGLTLEELQLLKETKEKTGLRYMMAETSYYRWPCITARKLYEDGRFGDLVYTEAEYYHNMIGDEAKALFYYQDRPTWRYGYPPMLYPTHSTAFLVGVTRERLTEVYCLGWGDQAPELKDNVYKNPLCNEAALYKTSGGNMFRCNVFWRIHAGGERAQWFGTKLAMYMPGSGGQPYIVQPEGGAAITQEPNYWHMVPETMRVDSGHGASHPFLTHEFIRAIVEDREPAVNVYEAIAMTAPGIVAHESALKGGERMKVPSFDKA
jgi:predicted dehydrogenase